MDDKRILTLDHIMQRISEASYDSQISVFKKRGGLDAVPTNTVATHEMIVSSDDFVGSFHKGFDLTALEVQLRSIEHEQQKSKRETS